MRISFEVTMDDKKHIPVVCSCCGEHIMLEIAKELCAICYIDGWLASTGGLCKKCWEKRR